MEATAVPVLRQSLSLSASTVVCWEMRMSEAKVERLECVTSSRTLSSAGSCSLDDDDMPAASSSLPGGGE
uniref:Uncharacterized protein n=1 Tax=Arundo donax TaxID=35708 RepID=A0A0A9VCV6_ARUDO